MTELILAVAVGLSALTILIQGLRIQRSLDRSRQAFEALLISFGSLGKATLDHDDRLRALERQLAELERHE